MLRVAPKFQSRGWAEHWLVGSGPTLRNVETARGGVIVTRSWNPSPFIAHHTSPADIPTLIDWSVSGAHCSLLFFLANLLKILPIMGTVLR